MAAEATRLIQTGAEQFSHSWTEEKSTSEYWDMEMARKSGYCLYVYS